MDSPPERPKLDLCNNYISNINNFGPCNTYTYKIDTYEIPVSAIFLFD